MKQEAKALEIFSLSKDKLTRGFYTLNKKMVEDPTTFWGQFNNELNITEYTEFAKTIIIKQSTKKFNYSDP